MKLKTKIWLEYKGKLLLGPGKCKILKAVAKYGSINTAAKRLDMSYRSVWAHLNVMEKRFPRKLIIKTKGGKSGGGAVLTGYARKLISKYEKLQSDIKKYAEKKLERIPK